MQRVGSWWSAVLRHGENMHYPWEQGLLPAELLEASGRRIVNGLLRLPVALEHWRGVAARHRPGFASWLDAAIEAERSTETRRGETGRGPARVPPAR